MKPQTAIRGVLSVGLINLLARLLAYGKHIIITAFIGLSAQLDAFYMATTVLALGIFVFGDVFDSLGIPRLIKVLQDEGEDSFRTLAGSILTFACILSAGLCVLLYAATPWTPWIAPGFSPEKKAFVIRNLVYLAPMAALYLPYHAVGSFLRARRKFHAFYIGEIVIAATTFVVLLMWHDLPYIIPISFSAAYVIVFAYVVAVAARMVRFPGPLKGERFRGLVRMIPALLPLYLTSYLFTLVDRAFASYLPTGGVSALSYGYIIAMIPCSLLMIDAIFMTPLAEGGNRGAMMGNILTGALIISIPIGSFTIAEADSIVKAAFERGVFTTASTRMTADALAFYSLALPAYFFWPVCYRLFQILEKLRSIGVISFIVVGLNGILNYLFMKMGMGVRGVALATAIAYYALVAAGTIEFRRFGIRIFTRSTWPVLLFLFAASGTALLVARLVPGTTGSTGELLVRGAVFLLTAGILVYFAPNAEIRGWRDAVLREIVPGPK